MSSFKSCVILTALALGSDLLLDTITSTGLSNTFHVAALPHHDKNRKGQKKESVFVINLTQPLTAIALPPPPVNAQKPKPCSKSKKNKSKKHQKKRPPPPPLPNELGLPYNYQPQVIYTPNQPPNQPQGQPTPQQPFTGQPPRDMTSQQGIPFDLQGQPSPQQPFTGQLQPSAGPPPLDMNAFNSQPRTPPNVAAVQGGGPFDGQGQLPPPQELYPGQPQPSAGQPFNYNGFNPPMLASPLTPGQGMSGFQGSQTVPPGNMPGNGQPPIPQSFSTSRTGGQLNGLNAPIANPPMNDLYSNYGQPVSNSDGFNSDPAFVKNSSRSNSYSNTGIFIALSIIIQMIILV